jgi:glutaredoxin
VGRVTVYGTDWCEDTAHARELLDKLHVSYDFVDIETDEQAREWVKQRNEGKEKKPTIKIGNEVLSVPEDIEIKNALQRADLLSEKPR